MGLFKNQTQSFCTMLTPLAYILVGKASAPARAPYLHPCRQKKTPILCRMGSSKQSVMRGLLVGITLGGEKLASLAIQFGFHQNVAVDRSTCKKNG